MQLDELRNDIVEANEKMAAFPHWNCVPIPDILCIPHEEELEALELILTNETKKAFFRDTHLDRFLYEIPFNEEINRRTYTREYRESERRLTLDRIPFQVYALEDLTKEILFSGLFQFDPGAANYRLDVFDELVQNPFLRDLLRQTVEKALIFRKIEERKRDRNWVYGIYEVVYGKAYVDLVELGAQFCIATSAGLKAVGTYFSTIQQRSEYKELHSVISSFDETNSFTTTFTFSPQGSITQMKFKKIEKNDDESSIQKNSILEGFETFKGGVDRHIAEDALFYFHRYFFECLGSPLTKSQQQQEATHLLLDQLAWYDGLAQYYTSQRGGVTFCRTIFLDAHSPTTIITKARHFSLKGDAVTNDISSSPERNLFVITGPNNAGKSTYLKTVGQSVAFAQAGLYVLGERAEISPRDGIYSHFVQSDEIAKGQGRYLNELARIRSIFELASPSSLLLLDEPCGGTSHEAGVEQAQTILDGLTELGCTTYYTTHMHELCSSVSSRWPTAVNLHVASNIKDGKLHSTYQIEEGPGQTSYATATAQRAGVTANDLRALIARKK